MSPANDPSQQVVSRLDVLFDWTQDRLENTDPSKLSTVERIRQCSDEMFEMRQKLDKILVGDPNDVYKSPRFIPLDYSKRLIKMITEITLFMNRCDEEIIFREGGGVEQLTLTRERANSECRVDIPLPATNNQQQQQQVFKPHCSYDEKVFRLWRYISDKLERMMAEDPQITSPDVPCIMEKLFNSLDSKSRTMIRHLANGEFDKAARIVTKGKKIPNAQLPTENSCASASASTDGPRPVINDPAGHGTNGPWGLANNWSKTGDNCNDQNNNPDNLYFDPYESDSEVHFFPLSPDI